jgi:hypothetical protein
MSQPDANAGVYALQRENKGKDAGEHQGENVCPNAFESHNHVSASSL